MQQTLDRKETGHTNECYLENHPNFGVKVVNNMSQEVSWIIILVNSDTKVSRVSLSTLKRHTANDCVECFEPP